MPTPAPFALPSTPSYPARRALPDQPPAAAPPSSPSSPLRGTLAALGLLLLFVDLPVLAAGASGSMVASLDAALFTLLGLIHAARRLSAGTAARAPRRASPAPPPRAAGSTPPAGAAPVPPPHYPRGYTLAIPLERVAAIMAGATLAETAHHEAAHYVAMRLLIPELPRGGLTVVREGDRLGCVQSGYLDDRYDLGLRMVVMFAGCAAEAKLSPTSGGFLRAFFGSQHDRIVVDHWLDALTDSLAQRHAATSRFEDLARRFVGARWTEIQALAAALLEARQLDRAAADQVLERAAARGDAGRR